LSIVLIIIAACSVEGIPANKGEKEEELTNLMGFSSKS
jgi:hypothetical protein